ncbi:hypothetical protein [Clostridium sp.]|uniref:hypothetical protein n=1 Tax=Clostridium sp. TaxID=1506 RepID=UPI003995FB0C
MEKEELKELLEMYVTSGFERVELELTGNRVITINLDKYKYAFNTRYFWFGGDGVNTSIDYRVIKSVAI